MLFWSYPRGMPRTSLALPSNDPYRLSRSGDMDQTLLGSVLVPEPLPDPDPPESSDLPSPLIPGHPHSLPILSLSFAPSNGASGSVRSMPFAQGGLTPVSPLPGVTTPPPPSPRLSPPPLFSCPPGPYQLPTVFSYFKKVSTATITTKRRRVPSPWCAPAITTSGGVDEAGHLLG